MIMTKTELKKANLKRAFKVLKNNSAVNIENEGAVFYFILENGMDGELNRRGEVNMYDNIRLGKGFEAEVYEKAKYAKILEDMINKEIRKIWLNI
jgi:hypothetical protein